MSSKRKKILRFLVCIVIIIPVLVIVFISPITKYLIEKYDVKYTGREITLDWAYVNPFTGYVHLSNFEVREAGKDTVFFSAKGVSLNFAMRKLMSKTYEISDLVLDQPRGTIIQNQAEKTLNFDDIIRKFSGKKGGPRKEPTHFSILHIKINDGEFHYREVITPVNFFITKVNIESTGLRWNSDSLFFTFDFLPGAGKGNMKGNITINTKNLDYRLATVVQKFDLGFIQQYLKDLVNYGKFSANLDADLTATGNFKEAQDLDARGMLAINDFHFGKDTVNDYASFDHFVLQMKELNPKNHKYIFDSLSLVHPYFKYERYDYLDNIQTMFGKKGANISTVQANNKFNLVIEIANYVKALSRNFFASYYKVTRLGIYNADMRYNDYSLAEQFSLAANPLTITGDSIDKNHDRVELSLVSGVKPYGNVNVVLSINPRDSGDFDLTYHLQKLPVPMFNPYLVSYTSFPMDRGTMEFKGVWHVRNGEIQSTNHLLIIDPRMAKRIKKKDARWLPLPLIMAFIRERGNVIDYDIPITGNLKNPKFHLKDVLLDLLENIFIKPPTTPYGIQVRNVENEVEKSLTLKWNMRQSCFDDDQEKFVKKMARFLEENPEASLSVSPVNYTDKEKEYILLFEAKKKYFLDTHHKTEKSFSEDDSLYVDKMSNKDSSFVHYLERHVSDSLLFSVQEKCRYFVGNALVNEKYAELQKKREQVFLSYFKDSETSKRVKIKAASSEVPYNGFSYFKIDYKGELPDYLLSANEELNQLNQKRPRNKYFRFRKKSHSVPEVHKT